MSIKDRNLPTGTKLVARYKGQEHTAEVVKTEEGIRHRLPDGREFKSLSSAGSAVMGGNACNGWRFWSLVGEEQPKAPKKAVAKKGKAKPIFERLEDGRFFCNACMEPFTAPNGVEPIGCPQGHQPGESAAK
jgi:hypothetical protein